MIERNTRLFVSLLVLLAAAAPASPQAAPSGSSTSRVATGKNGKSGNSRSSLATGATPGPSSRLCFQPGVGWQSILPGQPSEAATRDTNASMGLEVSGSASGANPQSAYPRLSGAKQVHSAECAGKLTEDQVPGVGIDKKSTALNSTIRSAGSTTKPGPVTPLRGNSPYHLNGTGGSGTGRTTAVPSAPASAASEGGPDAPSDLLGVRAFHAYTSSIKLRRLIRNAPDFRTRIRLQQLQDNPANQLHRARVDTKAGQAARRPLKAERVSRSSSMGSVTHGGPRDNSRTLLSAAPR
jgi:hypothetical protein